MIEVGGSPAGYAIYFYNGSNYFYKRGIYIEEIHIKDEY